jgi:hypothetical protein
VDIGWLAGKTTVWQGAMVPVAIIIAVGVTAFVHRKVRKLGKEEPE